MPEIATQFFIMGIVSGVIGVIFKLNDMKLNDITQHHFKRWSKKTTAIGAALVVAGTGYHAGLLGGIRSDNTYGY